MRITFYNGHNHDSNPSGSGFCFRKILWVVLPLAFAFVFSSQAAGPFASTTLTLMVTNASDVVDGNTSSVSALIAAPGADGISFREALDAANNTTGSKAIVFDPTLQGATITLSANGNMLLLESGDLTILGDIDLDGQPDITLDGSNCLYGPCSHGAIIVSSNNTINGLHFLEFTGAPVIISCRNVACGNKELAHIKIINNILTGTTTAAPGITLTGLGLGPSSEASLYSDIHFIDILISGNTITSVGEALYIAPANGGVKRNQLIGFTVSNNKLISQHQVAFNINVADVDSEYFGIPGPNQFSEDTLAQNIIITGNEIQAPNGFGMMISGGNYGNNHNQLLDLVINNNTIKNCQKVGIMVNTNDSDGEDHGSNYNLVKNVEIKNNVIDQVWVGIQLLNVNVGLTRDAASHDSSMENVTVSGNTITNFSGAGINMISALSGGAIATQNSIKNVSIHDNTMNWGFLPFDGSGILVVGGENYPNGVATFNTVSGLSIYDNTVTGTRIGIAIWGGDGVEVEGNRVELTRLEGNDLQNNVTPLEIKNNNRGAVGNVVIWPYQLFLPVVNK